MSRRKSSSAASRASLVVTFTIQVERGADIASCATLAVVEMGVDCMTAFDRTKGKRFTTSSISQICRLESLYTKASVKEIGQLIQATASMPMIVIVNSNGNLNSGIDVLQFGQWLQEKSEQTDGKLSSNLKLIVGKKSNRRPLPIDRVPDDFKKSLR